MSREIPGAAADVFTVEAEAEAAQQKLASEGAAGLQNRCPQCGALGSLEEFEDGELRCIDCDEVVAATRRLGGFGSR